MTVTITIANRKGGVGKTTTAVTIAHGLARLGKRVVLLDLDSQGQAALCLGLERSGGIIRLLVDGEPLEAVSVNARENLCLVPGSVQTNTADVFLHKRKQILQIIHRLIRKMRDVDVVMMDTPPSATLLQKAALAASDLMLIPSIMDRLSLEGLAITLEDLGEIRKKVPAAARFGIRLLPTLYERSVQAHKRSFVTLAERYGEALWPPIPRDARLREAQANGKTLWEWSPTSAAAAYYMNGKLVGGYQPILERVLEMIT